MSTYLTDRFICVILTVKKSAALAACLEATTDDSTKKVVNFFEEKSAPQKNPGYAPDFG